MSIKVTVAIVFHNLPLLTRYGHLKQKDQDAASISLPFQRRKEVEKKGKKNQLQIESAHDISHQAQTYLNLAMGTVLSTMAID